MDLFKEIGIDAEKAQAVVLTKAEELKKIEVGNEIVSRITSVAPMRPAKDGRSITRAKCVFDGINFDFVIDGAAKENRDLIGENIRLTFRGISDAVVKQDGTTQKYARWSHEFA